MDLSAKYQLVLPAEERVRLSRFRAGCDLSWRALEIVLDRALEGEGFRSSFSTTVASVCALAEAFLPLR